MISSLIKHTLRLIYLARKTNFSGVTFKRVENIVWVKIYGFRFFHEEELINTMGIINALSQQGIRFNIRFTTKIGKIKNSNVYFAYCKFADPFKFYNYTHTIHFICKELEEQGCVVHPKSSDVLFWENKGYMTRKFFEYKISTPKTFLITNPEEISQINLSYPFLLKEEHSFSSFGLHKISTEYDLQNFFKKNNYFESNKFLIAQELLDMRRDLRVIMVGNKVVHHYWRINKSDEWKPTSTSFGSGVDFGNFPEQWRTFILNEFKKLNLTTGAFDIAWRNDDLSTEPLILEVSPNFQPNPAVDFEKIKISYGEYKKKLLFRNSYDYKYVDIVFSIVHEQIKYLQESRKSR